MNRVLVTGANGFLGRQCIAPLIARGFEVHAVSRTLQLAAGQQVVWHRADLLDPAQTAALFADVRPSHCLHLAWYTRPGKYWRAAENLDWLCASLTIARSFASTGGRRLLVAGTCAEYDWRYGWCVESLTPCAPSTVYGASKHSLHLALAEFARDAGLGFAWARLFWLYGPYEHPDRLVASVARALLSGQIANCSEGLHLRDYLHVLDAADALAALIDSGLDGVVNVASGQPVAIRDVVNAVADAAGRPDLVRFGTQPASADEPFVVAADTRRLNRELSWRPHRSLKTGIAETVAWWRMEESCRGSGGPG